jgi:hypothetical protein
VSLHSENAVHDEQEEKGGNVDFESTKGGGVPISESRSVMYQDEAVADDFQHANALPSQHQFAGSSTCAVSPIVHLCGLFALRYEAGYILPWIAHHARYGVDHFHLYLDDFSSSWDPKQSDVHERLLGILSNHPKISLYWMTVVGLSSQEEQLNHCRLVTAPVAEWAGNWDFDESLVSHTAPTTACMLKTLLGSLSNKTIGVTMPRHVMRATNIHGSEGVAPFADGQLEYAQYVLSRLKSYSNYCF